MSSKRLFLVSGVALLIFSCLHFVYGSMAIVAAMAVGGFEVVLAFLKGFFAMGPDEPTVPLAGTQTGPAMIDAYLSIGSLALGSAVFAMVAGILALRNRTVALYPFAVVIVYLFMLGFRHLEMAWYVGTVAYTVLGVAAVLCVVTLWMRRPARNNELRLIEPPAEA